MKYSTVDQYILKKKLGTGATADILLAFDEKNNRHVALKILKNNDQEVIESEVKFLRNLEHKNIIKIFDVQRNRTLKK